MSTAVCCECDGNISLDEGTIKGEIVQCPDCGVELEVESVKPVMLRLAPQEEEDWGE